MIGRLLASKPHVFSDIGPNIKQVGCLKNMHPRHDSVSISNWNRAEFIGFSFDFGIEYRD